MRDKQGNVSRYIGVLSDISEQKKAQETIYLQANYDELTLLPNRRLFLDRLEQEIKKARRSLTQVALIFVDLDNFKEINDSFGHELGDKLLKEAAQRIQTCVREVDTVARLGGDEFTVVLPYVRSNREADRVAQKIVDGLSAPFNLGEDQGYVMDKKQTAVEWLMSRFEDGDMYNVEDAHFIKHQALKMEKEQIMMAVYDSMGTNFDPNMGRAEQYYTENYGETRTTG